MLARWSRPGPALHRPDPYMRVAGRPFVAAVSLPVRRFAGELSIMRLSSVAAYQEE